LYDQILDRLSGIGDVWLAASNRDYCTADRLGREYCDELRLVLDDLGWGDHIDEAAIQLTTPPDVLRRVFGRLGSGVVGERAQLAAGWAENRALEERNRLVNEACRTIIGELGGSHA